MPLPFQTFLFPWFCRRNNKTKPELTVSVKSVELMFIGNNICYWPASCKHCLRRERKPAYVSGVTPQWVMYVQICIYTYIKDKNTSEILGDKYIGYLLIHVTSDM